MINDSWNNDAITYAHNEVVYSNLEGNTIFLRGAPNKRYGPPTDPIFLVMYDQEKQRWKYNEELLPDLARFYIDLTVEEVIDKFHVFLEKNNGLSAGELVDIINKSQR